MTQSKIKLLELINNANYPIVPLSELNVELNDVTPASGGGAAWNTRVTCMAIPDRGYQGSRTLFYRRLALSVIGSGVRISMTGIDTPQALLDALNTTYGAWLDLEDLQAFELPTFTDTDPINFTLTAAAGSYGWTGSITLVLQAPTP